jgi:hypothetical protein
MGTHAPLLNSLSAIQQEACGLDEGDRGWYYKRLAPIPSQVMRHTILVIGMEQSSPEIVVILVVRNLLWTVLEPIRQGHVAVGQINGVGPFKLGSYRVLLRKHKTHDFAEFHVIDEKANMDRVGRELGRPIRFIFQKVVFGDHLDICVLWVDADWSSQGYGNRSIARKQGPPDSLPEPLVRST